LAVQPTHRSTGPRDSKSVRAITSLEPGAGGLEPGAGGRPMPEA